MTSGNRSATRGFRQDKGLHRVIVARQPFIPFFALEQIAHPRRQRRTHPGRALDCFAELRRMRGCQRDDGNIGIDLERARRGQSD